jgi:hypothetical protein
MTTEKNVNILENILFRSVIKRAPNVSYFSKSLNIPNVSIAAVPYSTPFSTIKQQGDHITFSPLEITFNIDEDLANYKEIITWMNSIGFPENYAQYGKTNRSIEQIDKSLVSDIEVMLFSNKSNPIHMFTFKNAWPSDLSGINMNIENDTVLYAECSVTFEYDTFEVA